MEWRNLYEEKQTTAENAAGWIQSRNRVVVGHACGSPERLLDAMTARKTHYEAVEIVHMVPMGKAEYCLPENARHFRHHSLFAGSATREALASGRADYTPCFFHEIPSLFRERILPVDVALITVSPPDPEGFVSLGVSVDYTREAVFSAKTVIAEETQAMPFTCGKSRIPLSRIDAMVRSGRQLPELAPSSGGDVEKAIGSHVSKLISDGDCLQLGIGAVPEAVLSFLSNKKDLGIHSEMISDGVMNLVEAGVITGKRKNLHPEKIIITFAMGSRKFYAWLHNNPRVEMHPVDYTNAPDVIGQNEGMVSINSAISVDLLGQVAADMLGPRQFSGVGGQVDFVRGCRLSTGGKSIIALPSTAARGTVSRIACTLDQGQAVTTSRNDVDYVVTEYGIAPLRGKTVKARAEALIAVASPAFRNVLRRQFDKLYF
jgi:4-hydroxybutyrate CoA-transferase